MTERALALAAAVEGDSEHTIAQAIRTVGAGARAGAAAGHRLRGAQRAWRASRAATGTTVYVGGPRLLEMLKLEPAARPGRLSPKRPAPKGQTVVYLVCDGQPVAAFALADVIRPESSEAVQRLHEMGVQVAMLTGDSEAVAKAVADELGIDQYFAEVLPENKDQKIGRAAAPGQAGGDGGRRRERCAGADPGRRGHCHRQRDRCGRANRPGIILVKSNPLDVVKIIELSRASYRKMVQNLVWATGYNVVALPLAAGVLAPVGILLSPAVGALLMSLSTVIVALNAQLLRRFKA